MSLVLRLARLSGTRQPLHRLIQNSLRANVITKPRFIRPSAFSMGVAHKRWYTSYKIAPLSAEAYHRLSDQTLECLVEYLEAIGDETDLDGYDVEYSQGVLTLKLGAHGTYVINKQPPNRQIWLSSPKSGPKRYDYDEEHKKWFYHRDNHTLDELLNTELSEILDKPVNILEALEK